MALSSLLATEDPDLGSAELDMCTFEMNIKHEFVPSVVCSFFFSLGLVYCFFGYRCFKMVMFSSGFLLGSAATLAFYHKEALLDARLALETKAGIGLAVAVLAGLMTMLVPTVGLLFSGLQLGGLLAVAALVVVGQFYSLPSLWVPLGGVLASSVAAAVLTLLWQKLFVVVYTSALGAGAVTLCADHLMGTSALPEQVYDMLHQGAPRRLCWFNWAIAGIFPTLSLMGALVQWGLTARGLSHGADQHQKHKKSVKKHNYRESRRRPHSHRRRRPPPLRRYNGDVLAPSYLQRLQEHQMGTGSSSSSVSTITHTLIDFDFETGSMVPLTAASPVFAV